MSLIFRVALVLCLVLLLVAGLLSQHAAPPARDGLDLAVHASTYAALTVLFGAIFGRSWLVAAGLLCLSVAIEGLQALTPGRVASWADLLANALGAAAGLVLQAVLEATPLGRRLVNRFRST